MALTQQQMEQKILALEKWKEERIKQQITFPLDIQSLTILSNLFLSRIGKIEYENAVGNNYAYALLSQAGKVDVVPEFADLVTFTANASTDVMTARKDLTTGSINVLSFVNGDSVNVFSTEALPAPLSDVTGYYIVSASGNTFKLSGTSGGAAINITDAGTGTHYIYHNI